MNTSEYLRREIADPKRELEAHLSEIELAAQFVSRASILRPRLGGLLNWNGIERCEKSPVSEFLSLRGANDNTLLTSLLVVCYGTFEKFVGELVERSIEAINKGCKCVDDVPKRLLAQNIYWTGRVFQSVNSQKQHLQEYDYVSLAKSLGTCDNEQTEFGLNSTCFSFELGTITSSNLEKLLNRIGMGLNWDQFGANDEIKDILGIKRTRDCSKAVRKSLDDLVGVRNVVSHMGGLNLVMDVGEVRKYARFFRPFSDELVSQIGAQMDSRFS